MRRKWCLCDDICKWLAFLIFLDKNNKLSVTHLTTLVPNCGMSKNPLTFQSNKSKGCSPQCGGPSLSLISSVFCVHIHVWVGCVGDINIGTDSLLASSLGLMDWWQLPVAPLHADVWSQPTEELYCKPPWDYVICVVYKYIAIDFEAHSAHGACQ